MSVYELRDYQKEAVIAAQGKKNGVLVLPTGSGKSLVIAALAEAMGCRIIVLQPTKEILEQNKAKMEAFGATDIGVYSASCNRKDIGQITFATIGSVIRHKEKFEAFDRVVVDECHLVNSKGGMYEEFLSHLKCPTIGLTATPYRMRSYNDNYRTGEQVAESRVITRTRPRIFSKVKHVTQVAELFARGYLCPLDYTINDDYCADNIKGNSTGQGYNDQSLLGYNRKQQLPRFVAHEIRRCLGLGSKHVLAFTMFRSETEQVCSYLDEANVSHAEVSGETPKRERESILTGFRRGDIKAVVNVGVLTTGFDFPELDAIVLGRPTRSVSLYCQMTGRGIRPAPGKEHCRLIDLCDNVRRFGRVETFELVDPMGGGRWRLRSDAGYQTDRDLISGGDLEPENTDDPELPFGKYQGRRLSDAPLDYIQWGAEKMTKLKKWKKRFKVEQSRREKGHIT